MGVREKDVKETQTANSEIGGQINDYLRERIGDGHPMAIFYHLGSAEHAETITAFFNEIANVDDGPLGNKPILRALEPSYRAMLMPVFSDYLSLDRVQQTLRVYHDTVDALAKADEHDSIHYLLKRAGMAFSVRDVTFELLSYLLSLTCHLPSEIANRKVRDAQGYYAYIYSSGFGRNPYREIGAFTARDEICRYIASCCAEVETAMTRADKLKQELMSEHNKSLEDMTWYTQMADKVLANLDYINAATEGRVRHISSAVRTIEYLVAHAKMRVSSLEKKDDREESLAPHRVVRPLNRYTQTEQAGAIHLCRDISELLTNRAGLIPIATDIVTIALGKIEEAYSLAPTRPEQHELPRELMQHTHMHRCDHE